MQIHEIISKMKMEIQKKIGTSRYNEMGSGPACADPGIFVRGGGSRSVRQKKL